MAGALILNSCGGPKEKKDAGTTQVDTTAASKPVADAPATITVNEADWEVKDLSTIAPDLHLSLKLPKDATIEKGDESSVDIKISDSYRIFASYDTKPRITTGADSKIKTIKQAMALDKEIMIGADDPELYVSSKVVATYPDGFIYTQQEKDKAGEPKHQPESHFYYYLLAKGPNPVIYIRDTKPFSSKLPDSAYTIELAKKVYAIIKASAKTNK